MLILLAAVFVAYKLIPVKVRSSELRQEVVDEAKSAALRTDKQLRANIMSKAEDLDLPLQDQDLIIRRGSGRISIEAEYVVPVEFPGYTYHWKFDHKAENPLF
ncbi:MAG TPA: hypothetical protein VM534_07695 [Thermoanaerobaculia bacterium]|nr:hypothetical protein [Thermoanaerobaculia bacterium]